MKFRKYLLLFLISSSVILNSTYAAVSLWSSTSAIKTANKAVLHNRLHLKKQPVTNCLLSEIQESEEEELDDFEVQLPHHTAPQPRFLASILVQKTRFQGVCYRAANASAKCALFIVYRNLRL